MNKDDIEKGTSALIEKVAKGEKLSEFEVGTLLYHARDKVLAVLVGNLEAGDLTELSSKEVIALDESGSGTKRYKRKDLLRFFNVLQNAVERHDDKHNQSAKESPLEAMARAWQAAAQREPEV